MNIEVADVTKHVLALLEGTRRPGAESRAPVNAPSKSDFPYWVVHQIPGGGLSGPPLTAPESDASIVYQVDSVGLTPDQAQRMATRVRRQMIGRGPDGAFLAAAAQPASGHVRDRMLDGAPGGVEPSGTQPHELYTVSDRFAVWTTPTA